jgi:hypothetical protein
VDALGVAIFRIVFGLVMIWEAQHELFGGPNLGEGFLKTPFHFKYYGFSWIEILPKSGMIAVFVVMGIAAILFTLGTLTRLAALALFVTLTYVFLLDQATYLNHMYLVCTLCFVFIFLPMDEALSIKAWRKGSRRIPRWNQWVLRAQIGMVYFWGGIAKLTPDWLVGEPVREWVAGRVIKKLLPEFYADERLVYFFCYGGIGFDLFVAPLLIWRKTRWPALIATAFFHLHNHWMFTIGIFPWLLLMASPIFFEPDWGRKILVRFKRSLGKTPDAQWQPEPLAARRAWEGLFALIIVLQLLIPLRHWLYPGMVHWTEEGHRFSWHMKLRTKHGDIRFKVQDIKTGQVEDLAPYFHISKYQYDRMTCRPDMILQYAHHIHAFALKQRPTGVRVFAEGQCRLNHHPPQPLIDPTVDLAQVERNLKHATWILPHTKKAKKVPHFRSR